jgi:hypothetical protein
MQRSSSVQLRWSFQFRCIRINSGGGQLGTKLDVYCLRCALERVKSTADVRGQSHFSSSHGFRIVTPLTDLVFRISRGAGVGALRCQTDENRGSVRLPRAHAWGRREAIGPT